MGPTCPSAPELLHPLRVAADAGARLRHVSRLLLHVRADTWHVRRLNAVWDAGVLWELPGELFEAVTRVVMRDLNDRFHSKLAALRPTGESTASSPSKSLVPLCVRMYSVLILVGRGRRGQAQGVPVLQELADSFCFAPLAPSLLTLYPSYPSQAVWLACWPGCSLTWRSCG